MRITQNGRVGIGTTDPGYKLEVNGGDLNVNGGIYQNGIPIAGASQWILGSGTLYYNANNVGIGTTNAEEKLDVVGNVRATNYLISSDERIKEGIVPLDDFSSLNTLDRIDPVSYRFKNRGGERVFGFIAQQVREHFSEAVSVSPGSGFEDFHSLNKDYLFTLNFSATKALWNRIQQLEEENDFIRRKLEELSDYVYSR